MFYFAIKCCRLFGQCFKDAVLIKTCHPYGVSFTFCRFSSDIAPAYGGLVPLNLIIFPAGVSTLLLFSIKISSLRATLLSETVACSYSVTSPGFRPSFCYFFYKNVTRQRRVCIFLTLRHCPSGFGSPLFFSTVISSAKGGLSIFTSNNIALHFINWPILY
jgi:hypothetical protein